MNELTNAFNFLGSSGDDFDEEVATEAVLDGPVDDPRSIKSPSKVFGINLVENHLIIVLIICRLQFSRNLCKKIS